MIIAIDFDGTIVEDQFPGIGDMMLGAKRTINNWRANGHFIIIWTCRRDKRMLEAIEWLAKAGIKYDKINESCPANVEKYSGLDTRKIYADLYIDDKQLHRLPSWDVIDDMVRERFPSYAEKVAREGFL